MSKFTVNLENESPKVQQSAPKFSAFQSPKNSALKPKKRGGCLKIGLLVSAVLLILVVLVGGIAGWIWWSGLQKSPAYSLALLVDAARKDDQKSVEQYLDTDAVVDSFLPQITNKAVERYGRGLPPQIISQITSKIAPFIPAVKERAREEIPKAIKDKASVAPDVPPWMMAAGIGRVVSINENGDNATVSGNLKGREIELTMKRNGDRWKVVAVKDAALADQIAEKIGQELIAAAKGGSLNDIGKKIGVKDAGDILKQVGDIFNK